MPELVDSLLFLILNHNVSYRQLEKKIISIYHRKDFPRIHFHFIPHLAHTPKGESRYCSLQWTHHFFKIVNVNIFLYFTFICLVWPCSSEYMDRTILNWYFFLYFLHLLFWERSWGGVDLGGQGHECYWAALCEISK